MTFTFKDFRILKFIRFNVRTNVWSEAGANQPKTCEVPGELGEMTILEGELMNFKGVFV